MPWVNPLISQREPMKYTMPMVAFPELSRRWKKPFIWGLSPISMLTIAERSKPMPMMNFFDLALSEMKPLMNLEIP